jgi:hypothetical protein
VSSGSPSLASPLWSDIPLWKVQQQIITKIADYSHSYWSHLHDKNPTALCYIQLQVQGVVKLTIGIW